MPGPTNSPTKQPSRGKLWLWLLKAALSAGLMALLLRKVSFVDAVQQLAHLQPFQAVAAFLLCALSLAFSGWRWQVASGRHLPLGICLRYTWIGHLYALILPGALSSDVAKGVVLASQSPGKSRFALTASIALDRIAGLGMLVVLGLFSSLARPGFLPLSPSWTLAIASTGLLLLCSLPFWLGLAAARWPALDQLMSFRRWAILLILSTLIHGVNITFYWCALLAVQGQDTWWSMAIYTCLLNLAMLLPVSLAGVGLREQLAVLFLAQGNTASTSVAFGFFVLLVFLGHALIGLALHWRQDRAPTEASPAILSGSTDP